MRLEMNPMIKALSTAALAVALLVGLGQQLVPTELEARSCYRIWAEADRMGSSYRHTVYVENDCDYWLQCSLWTDVDPQPPVMLSVGPGMTEHGETNGSSQYDDPRAFGACRRQ